MSNRPHSVHANESISAAGFKIIPADPGEIRLLINILSSPTGSTPGLQYSVQEVDPGDEFTPFGPIAMSTILIDIGIEQIILPVSFGIVKISWDVSGTTPEFPIVNATIVSREINTLNTDNGGSGGGSIVTSDVFTSTPNQQVFTLTHTPINFPSVFLFINGQLRTQGLEYSISGNTITWLNTPFNLDTDEVYIEYTYE